ncbi:LPP20 family lipoprotein [Helicobacter sp. MIT 21-1697]|uniref:LPP20 family lipoprotein n=1 Tax=Helicobacter sp. MIT 21-1697 TaxID=2993733 RepID=UPI00224B3DE7|nr:LPP20 family lipoprotein [Helicobacter sp. MIT 21-1697]MCX2716659.1 LPP20 family lipoprotein [Helicobacter sp. MIT 21-1697]
MRLVSVLAIGTIFLLGGCGGNSPKPPSWYGKDAHNDTHLIGFGNATSLDSAKARALNDISSQLSVQVSSQFKSHTQRQDSSLTHKTSNEIKLDVAAIELSDVSYVKDEFKDNQFFIKAQIPKSSLVRQFQSSFNTEYNTLNFNRMSQCSSISIKDKMRLEYALNKLNLYTLLLHSLGSNAKDMRQLEKLLSMNSPLPTARLNIQSNARAEVIESELAKELGEFYSFDSQAHNLINVKLKLALIGGATIKADAIMTIYDCRNNPVFTTSVSNTHKGNSIDDSLSFTAKRIGVQLYKKIQEWIEQ